MSLFTSVFWSIFTADSLVKGIIKKPDYSLYKSPETYPLLETVDCSSKYLSLSYLCDPDHWLTHTEAQKFDQFFKNRLRRLEICRKLTADEIWKIEQKGLVANYHPKFVVGFAFADNLKTMQFRKRSHAMRSIQNSRKTTVDDHFCTANDGNVEKTSAFVYETRSVEFDPIIQKSLDFAADRIRHRWNMEIGQISSSKSYCQFDLVLLIARQITVCLNDRKLIAKNAFRTNSFLIGFGYDSEKLSKIFDEPSASSSSASSSSSSSTLKHFNFGFNNNNNKSVDLDFNNNFSHFPPNDSNQKRSVIDFLKKILTDLDVFVEKKLKNGVVTSDENHSGKYAILSVHGVPMWAIVVFAALLAVTFSCVAVSHWINIGQRGRNRSRQRDRVVAGVKSPNDRRWRAGFAGGVMDMHVSGDGASQKTSNGAGSASSNKKRGLFASAPRSAHNKAHDNYRRV